MTAPTPDATVPKLDTPLMRQYQALKASYPHAILLFHLGDFYEMFGDDARAASPALGLVLTHRQGLPMCGVPVHSVSGYVAKLLKAGHKVALAEQVEDPALAKGLVRRQVTRLITPGTVIEEELLDASSANYLAALELDTVGWGLACLEVSTGEFWATQSLNDPGARQLLSLLARLDPAEVLAAPDAAERLGLRSALPARAAWTPLDAAQAPPRDEAWAREPAWRDRTLAARAAAAAKRYAIAAQSRLADTLVPTYRETQGELQLDENAVRTLELVSAGSGERRHSLWGVLDRCRTPMGSRRLKSWILHPLLDLREIERRQNCVEELLEKAAARRELGRLLSEVADVERVVNRLATRSASARDLAALRDSLGQLAPLRAWLAGAQLGSALSTLGVALDEAAPGLEELRALLERGLLERPGARLADGNLIRPGFDRELDELRSIREDSRHYLSALEARERGASGIGSLKVGFNSIFGYYIEVGRAHLAKVPPAYHRKQTLANAERFVTAELKELEAKILGAEGKSLRRELQLFEGLRAEALKRHAAVSRFAALASEADALASLAEAAALHDYAKPKVDLSHALEVEDGRHPVVEAVLPSGSFVPNSVALDGRAAQVLVLTGPNMGGKSTYLRQNALIAIMAQMGGFVPARRAVVGLVDKILTRIGSQDALARNESTFMVEMRETAQILRSATTRSLVILDEVGRGTSTFDGISIAWAVLEHLNAAYRLASGAPDAPLGPRVLFATHYFELTRLAETLPGVVNASVEAREWTGPDGRHEVVFLHKISPGPADRSFGIHVARLAGLPEAALRRARELLAELESRARAAGPPGPGRAPPPEPALPLFDEHPVLGALRRIEVDRLTPLEALEKVAEWKARL